MILFVCYDVWCFKKEQMANEQKILHLTQENTQLQRKKGMLEQNSKPTNTINKQMDKLLSDLEASEKKCLQLECETAELRFELENYDIKVSQLKQETQSLRNSAINSPIKSIAKTGKLEESLTHSYYK